MRLIATLLSLTAAGLFLGGCSTNSGGGYEDPDNLRTQQEMQEAQSRILRRNL